MNNNYINVPKLYKLGFILSDYDILRIKQGLAPQIISNVCIYNAPNTNAYPTQGIPKGSYYDHKNMRDYCKFSSKQVQLSYGLPDIPKEQLSLYGL